MGIVAAGAWIYSPAWRGDWVWDDHMLLADNTDLRSPGGLANIWFSSPSTDYWPLTWTLLWIEWHLWGANPLGYHLTSLALHISSGLLIWRLFHRLGLRWGWLGGFLFVVHPLAVESVAWISEIKNTLSLPFFLLSLDAWLDAEEGKPSGYLRSVLFYLAAMLAKTSTVMLPAVLLLYGWWKRGHVTRQEVVRTIPYALIALVLGLLTIYFQNHGHARDNNPVELGGIVSRLIGAGTALCFYLGQFILPMEVLPIYPRWSLEAPSLLHVLTLPVLVGLLVCLWAQRKGWGRHLILGFGFFMITLLPVLGLVKMEYLNISWVADHLVYLPMIGLIGLTVTGLDPLLQPSRFQPWSLGIIVLVMGLFIWKSHVYAGQFSDEKTLWTYTLPRNPQAWLAHNNLGTLLLREGQVDAAIEQFEEALKIAPHYAEAHYDLGNALKKSGRMSEAIEQYQRALAIDSAYAEAHNNLADTFLQTGDSSRAFDQFQQAIQSNPDYAEAHYNWGVALIQAGHLPEAIVHFRQAIQIDPDYIEAHFNLGAALYQTGHTPESIQQFQEVLRLKPDFTQAQNILAQLQAQPR